MDPYSAYDAPADDQFNPEPPVPVDFTSLEGIVGSDAWRTADPQKRINTVPLALNKFMDELTKEPGRKVMMRDENGEEKELPLSHASGQLTSFGKDYFERGRGFLEAAARHPEGGTEFDVFDKKRGLAYQLDGLMDRKRKQDPDPFAKYDEAKEAIQAVAPEGKPPEMSYEAYAAHVNEGLDDNSPARLDPENPVMKERFARKKALAEFDTEKMGDDYLAEVGGQTLFNPKKLADVKGMNAAIDASDNDVATKRLMKVQLREQINGVDTAVINQASDAADNSFGLVGPFSPVVKSLKYAGQDALGMESSDLNSRFNKHMENPANDLYSFLEQNAEELSQDRYGMADKLTNAFWSANRSTGAGALWLASKPFGGSETATSFASDSSRSDESAWDGMGGTENYRVLGMDFTNKGFYDLAGQVASMMTTFGGGAALKGGIKVAGTATAATATEAAKLGTGVMGKAAGKVLASEAAMKTAMTTLAPNTLKNLGIKALRDPSAYIGGLQAAGMSFGSTYNQEIANGTDPEEAYRKADMQATANGLSAFIATAAFNRIAPGLEKGMTGVEGGLGGSIFKHMKFNQALKSNASENARKAAIETIEALAKGDEVLAPALGKALRETVTRAARANGLKGYGPVPGIFAEAAEEMSDTILSDIFHAMLDDSTTWKGEVWDNIGEKFSEYMAAAVMGAFGGALGGTTGMLVEEGGQLRQKNREARVKDIREFAEVAWKDIKENTGTASELGVKVKTPTGISTLSLANYAADESIPLEKRARVIAEHAVSGFSRRLEQSAAEPVQAPSSATPEGTTAPPAAPGKPAAAKAKSSLASEVLGTPPQGMEWNEESLNDEGLKEHEFKLGGEKHSFRPLMLARGGVAGGVLTSPDGTTRNLSAKEASALLKTADPSWLGKFETSRTKLVQDLDAFQFDPEDYAQPATTNNAAGAGAAATATDKPEGSQGTTPPAEEAGAQGTGTPRAKSAPEPETGAPAEALKDEDDDIDLSPSSLNQNKIKAGSQISRVRSNGETESGVVTSIDGDRAMIDVGGKTREVPTASLSLAKEIKEDAKLDLNAPIEQSELAGRFPEGTPSVEELKQLADSMGVPTDVKFRPGSAEAVAKAKAAGETTGDDVVQIRLAQRIINAEKAGYSASNKIPAATGTPKAPAAPAEGNGGGAPVDVNQTPSGETQAPLSSTSETQAAPRSILGLPAAFVSKKMHEEVLGELWNEGVRVVVGSNEAAARELHNIPADVPVLLLSREEARNKGSLKIKVVKFRQAKRGPTTVLNALPEVSSKRDEEYLAAVKSGDMETAQRMVDDAAKAAGYTMKASHGGQTGINSFDASKIKSQEAAVGFFFALGSNREQARIYADKLPGGKLYDVFLKMRNPYYAKSAYPSAPANSSEVWNTTLQSIKSLYGIQDADMKIFRDNVEAYPFNILGDVGEFKYRLYLFLESPAFSEMSINAQAGIATMNQTLRGEYGAQTALDMISLLTKRDGVIFKDGEVASVLRPENIKSAEPVTYDADGKVIPLSKRFNPFSDSILNALPDVPGDALFKDPSAPGFFVDLSIMNAPDEFGGIWTKEDDQLFYTPAKGKTLPIGDSTVVEIAGDSSRVLVMVGEQDGSYQFQEVSVEKFAAAMGNERMSSLHKANLRFNRNRLEEAGEKIRPLLNKLLAKDGTVSEAAFKKMLADIMAVVAPGSNPALLRYTTMSGGAFFNVSRDTSTSTRFQKDQSAFDDGLVKDSNGDPVIEMLRVASEKPKVETSGGQELTAEEQKQLAENEAFAATQPPIVANPNPPVKSADGTTMVEHYVTKTGEKVRVDQYVPAVRSQAGKDFTETELSINIDREAFVANLRSVFNGYRANQGEVYDGYVANEVARQIAAFVDEEQTHFVALKEFTDEEIQEGFDSFVMLASILDKDKKIENRFVNDLFRRIAAQRVPGKALDAYTADEKFLVASETLRAINQLLTTGTTTEAQSTDSKRLLEALNQDFSGDKKSPWKTVVELLQRYLRKIRSMAHLRFMQGKLPAELNDLIRRQETAYINANLRGDVDNIKGKGLADAAERFTRAREGSKKAIGKVAMMRNESLNGLKAAAEDLGVSLDDMLVLDYQKGQIRLRDDTDPGGLNIRGMLAQYQKEVDVEELDTALAELNAAEALPMIQRDLGYAWNQLQWARNQAPNFLRFLDGSNGEQWESADQRIKGEGAEENKKRIAELRSTERFRIWSQLLASAPDMDNGQSVIRHFREQIEMAQKVGRARLHNANVQIVKSIGNLDLNKLSDGIKATRIAELLDFNLELSRFTAEELADGKWQKMLTQHALEMALEPGVDERPMLASNALSELQEILFPGEAFPVAPEIDRLRSDLEAFEKAQMTEEQENRLALSLMSEEQLAKMSPEEKAEVRTPNLTAEEQAALAKIKTAKQIEAALKDDGLRNAHATLKARRLRLEASKNGKLAEEDMRAYEAYVQALANYNDVNRRVVELVIGADGVSNSDFGLRFQSLVYQPLPAKNQDELQAKVKALQNRTGGNVFQAPEVETLKPTTDIHESFGYPYVNAADALLIRSNPAGLPLIRAGELNPVFREMDANGNLLPIPGETAVMVPVPEGKDMLINREVGSNLSAVGMHHQMMWQRLLGNVGIKVPEAVAERYEGTYGFNAGFRENEELGATRWEDINQVLPSYNITQSLYAYESTLPLRADSLSKERLATLLGVPFMVETKDGPSFRPQHRVSLTAKYPEGSYAAHIQELKVWATKILNSTDPDAVVGDIAGIQTLAGRLSPRMHLRAKETLEFIEAQEAEVFSVHMQAPGLTAKQIATGFKNALTGPAHERMDLSIRALRNETRWARGAVRRFERQRRNIVEETVSTNRDTGWTESSDFFGEIRDGWTDLVTLRNTLWGINHFSKSRREGIDATFGINLYEKFRRIGFSKQGDELVLGKAERTVPVFERENGQVIFDDLFVTAKGEWVTANDPGFVEGLEPAMEYYSAVEGTEVYRSMRPARRARMKRDAEGNVETETIDAHEDMDPTEVLAHAMQDRDADGRFPLTNEMGEQGNTVAEARDGRASAEGVRSRVQRAQSNVMLEKQLQNKVLTETALLVGMRPWEAMGDKAPADAPREFLGELLELEKNPSGYDAWMMKAMDGLFNLGQSQEGLAEASRYARMFHNYVHGAGSVEVEVEEWYDSEEALPPMEMPKPPMVQESPFSDEMVPATDRLALRKYEEALVQWKLQQDGQQPTQTIKRSRKVKRMESQDALPVPAAFEREINPFELMQSLVEWKAKQEMDLIDQGRIEALKGGMVSAEDGRLVDVMKSLVGSALAMPENAEIKPTFNAMAAKMAELGMGDLFVPGKPSGNASAEDLRLMAVMLHDESHGDAAIDLHEGNVFAQFNETELNEGNKLVNLLVQNIPGIAVYRPSKQARDKHQAYFGSRLIAGANGGPPVFVVGEGNTQAENRAVMAQALSWWAKESQDGELIATSLAEAAARVRVALSPITHVERFTHAVWADGKAMDKFLGDYAESVIRQNPGKIAEMDAAAKEARTFQLAELIREHFTNMETLQALARDTQHSKVNTPGIDLALLGVQGQTSDLLLMAEALTNPKMKQFLDRFMFGDNLINTTELENPTLHKILLGIAQAGQEAREEQSGFENENALERATENITPEEDGEVETEAPAEEDMSFAGQLLKWELDQANKLLVDSTELADPETELDIEPSTEEKAAFNAMGPTAKDVLQFFREHNHDKERFGPMDERMEQVLADFHRGGFNGDKAWEGSGVPASEAMLFNFLTDVLSLAKARLPEMNAQTQIEGAGKASTGRQLLEASSSPLARPVVARSGRARAVANLETLPGREASPTVTAWHNMMQGRRNGRTASTLYFESNRFRNFAGGLLSRVGGIATGVERASQSSIEQGLENWRTKEGSSPNSLILFPKAHADIELTEALYEQMKQSFPQLASYEAEAVRELAAMEKRKSFLEGKIGQMQGKIREVEERLAGDPKVFDETKMSAFTEDQRESIALHIIAEAEGYARTNTIPHLEKRTGYQRLLNQTIASMGRNPTRATVAAAQAELTTKLGKSLDALEAHPDSPTNVPTRTLLNEMQLPGSLKAEMAQTMQALTPAEYAALTKGREVLEQASAQLNELTRLHRNPRKGGYFQRVAHEATTPFLAGEHLYVAPEKGPTGRAMNVRNAIVLYPPDFVSNLDNKMAIADELRAHKAKWSANPARSHEFYARKVALKRALDEYARHADTLFMAVKRREAYFMDYNPAAVVKQVTDTMAMQKMVAEARMAEFKENKGLADSVQLSPDALALLADPDTDVIYSASHVVEMQKLRQEIDAMKEHVSRLAPMEEKLARLLADKNRDPKVVPVIREQIKDLRSKIDRLKEDFIGLRPLREKLAKLRSEKNPSQASRDQALSLEKEIAGKTKLKDSPVTPDTILAKENQLSGLAAKRRVSRYAVPANFAARKDIIGHLIDTGEWVMLGQMDAEQDLKNRFFSETERKAKRSKTATRNIVLNSLPEAAADAAAAESLAQNRMGFDSAWRAAAWNHTFAGEGFESPTGTREQAAKVFASRHFSQLVERVDNRPAEKQALVDAKRPLTLASGKKVSAANKDVQNVATQLGHMVEQIVLAYDKIEVKGVDDKALKAQMKGFLESLAKGDISQSDAQAQQVRLVELFAKVSAKIEGEAALSRLMLGLSHVGSSELVAMKYLHHHDARVRARYRKNYISQLEAMRLHGILQNGFDMNSGRDGWTSQMNRAKEEMNEAMKDLLGKDSLQQSIPLMIASLNGMLDVRTHSVAANLSMWANDLKQGVRDLKTLRTRQEEKLAKRMRGTKAVRGFVDNEHVNILRDIPMVNELYRIIKPMLDQHVEGVPGDTTPELYAVEIIEKAVKALESESKHPEASAKYAAFLREKFKGLTDASELMMAAMGHAKRDASPESRWQGFLDGSLRGDAKFVSTLPLKYAYANDPLTEKIDYEFNQYRPDPLDAVNLQELSLLGGPGRSAVRDKKKASQVYRPVSINGISTVESLMDDTLYRLNVAPVYTAMRQIVGSVQDQGPNSPEIVNSLILGETESEKDFRNHRVALAGIAWEMDNEVANDLQNGVVNTALAETIQFLSSNYIFKALFSIQQWWNQAAPSVVGYQAKKLVSGKPEDARMMFEIMGKILHSKTFGGERFNSEAKGFVGKVAPWVNFAGADGMDPIREQLRKQTRYGVGKGKAFAGKAGKELQHYQEKGLDFTIAKPERMLRRAIFLTELMSELKWMQSQDMIQQIPESVEALINEENGWAARIPQEAVESAQMKVNDHMGVADQGKKGFFFQNKTSSPGLNMLMKSIVRFSNHQSSTSSNASVLLPTLWQADTSTEGGKRAKRDAIENITGTLVQNSLFHAMKLRTLIPVLAYFGYMLGGEDEDDALVMAQELTDRIFNIEGEDNPVIGGLKAAALGKPGQFFQDWKDPDASAASGFAGLGASMGSELLPALPLFGGAFGYFPFASAFKGAVTNSVVQDATAVLTGLDSAEERWDPEAVYVYERKNGGVQTAMQMTAPTAVLYDLVAGLNLAREAAGTGEVDAYDISSYLFQEFLLSTREGRQVSKKVLQTPVWENRE